MIARQAYHTAKPYIISRSDISFMREFEFIRKTEKYLFVWRRRVGQPHRTKNVRITIKFLKIKCVLVRKGALRRPLWSRIHQPSHFRSVFLFVENGGTTLPNQERKSNFKSRKTKRVLAAERRIAPSAVVTNPYHITAKSRKKIAKTQISIA